MAQWPRRIHVHIHIRGNTRALSHAPQEPHRPFSHDSRSEQRYRIRAPPKATSPLSAPRVFPPPTSLAAFSSLVQVNHNHHQRSVPTHASHTQSQARRKIIGTIPSYHHLTPRHSWFAERVHRQIKKEKWGTRYRDHKKRKRTLSAPQSLQPSTERAPSTYPVFFSQRSSAAY